jgi:glycosyltransferase involved in cell wall biosynthesis
MIGQGSEDGSIVFVLPSFAGGGAERAVITLAIALRRRGADARLIVLDGAGPLAAAITADLPLAVLGVGRVRRAARPLVRAIRAWRPRVVVPTMGHLNLLLLALRPFLGGVRIVPREANAPAASHAASGRPRLQRLAYRLLYPGADRVLCNSRAVAAELVRDAGVAADRVVVLPNPVDVTAIRAAAHALRREPGPGRRLVAAGRLTRQKGFDRLLAVARRLSPDDRVLVLGEGADAAALRAVAPPNVTFAGFDPNPWPWYAGADAFLLPSRWEGMPNAVLEALACGTPVIAAPEAGGAVELAAEAPVTIAELEDGFLDAIARVVAAPLDAPRPCLLPARFHADAAAAAFLAALGL